LIEERRLRRADARRLPRVRLKPGPPLGGGAVEDVDVGIALYTGHFAGTGVLPEQEALAVVDLVWMIGHRTQPPVIAFELAQTVLVVEIDRRVNDRALAVVTLDDVEENLHLALDGGCWRTHAARRGQMVPLHVEHMR